MHELAGKTLILSGASRGIGKALALELAREKVNLVINARSEGPLRETRDECLELGISVEYIVGDASKTRTVMAMAEKAQSMDDFFGFIHAAGVLYPGPYIWEIEEHDFQTVFQANVYAAFLLIQQCVPLLLKQEQGLAVFFGSGAAEKIQPGIAAYCSAKAAEEHLARQLAVEAPQITTFVYRPGIVETRMQEQARQASGGAADEVKRVFKSWKEKDMLMSPEESATALVRLLSSEPGRLHGETWDVRDLIL
ncbi:MAG: SDR family NAD(P)-dependent oxidoreductase [Desulfonatronovibrio sp.]